MNFVCTRTVFGFPVSCFSLFCHTKYFTKESWLGFGRNIKSPLLFFTRFIKQIIINVQWRIYIVKFWTRAPPGGPNSFNFMQFLGKYGKIVCWRPPGELAPTPRGNPGSATYVHIFFIFMQFSEK